MLAAQVTLTKWSISPALLTAFREMCE